VDRRQERPLLGAGHPVLRVGHVQRSLQE
jgi:hypothetical protein